MGVLALMASRRNQSTQAMLCTVLPRPMSSGQDAAEAVHGQIDEEMEAIDLIGPKVIWSSAGTSGLVSRSRLVSRALTFSTVPVAMNSLRSCEGKLTGVDGVRFVGEFVDIDAEGGDGLLLLLAEFETYTAPGAVGQADVATAWRQRGGEFRRA